MQQSKVSLTGLKEEERRRKKKKKSVFFCLCSSNPTHDLDELQRLRAAKGNEARKQQDQGGGAHRVRDAG